MSWTFCALMEKGPLQLTHVGRLNIKRRCAHLLCLCTTIQQAEAYTIQTYDHRGDTPRWKGNDGMAVINQPGVRYPGKGLVLILLLSGLFATYLLPRRPLLVQARIGVLLDGLIIMVGLVTFSWYFVLGPEVLQGANTLAGRIIGMANPLAALLLIFCLLRLMARSHDREMQPV